jgi:hypothetical protein
MIYAICEDYKSGLRFWTNILNSQDSLTGFRIESCKGSGNLYSFLENLLSEGISARGVKSGDTLLIISDSLFRQIDSAVPAIENSRSWVNMIKYAQTKFEPLGVRVCYTTYFSFEEFILRFKLLPQCIGSKNNQITELLTRIHMLSLQGSQFKWWQESLIQSELTPAMRRVYQNGTEEQFLSTILEHCSGKEATNREMHISKGSMGRCWISDCEKVVNDYTIEKICKYSPQCPWYSDNLLKKKMQRFTCNVDNCLSPRIDRIFTNK